MLWKELLVLINKHNDGEWLLGGDFNTVKTRNERIGSSAYSKVSKRREFFSFIESTGLMDVPCKGRKFSWCSGDGYSKRRIDMFLISDNIVSS